MKLKQNYYIIRDVCKKLAGEQCLYWAGCDSNTPAFNYVKEIFKYEQLCR